LAANQGSAEAGWLGVWCTVEDTAAAGIIFVEFRRCRLPLDVIKLALLTPLPSAVLVENFGLRENSIHVGVEGLKLKYNTYEKPGCNNNTNI
jgi:hypothetical protein